MSLIKAAACLLLAAAPLAAANRYYVEDTTIDSLSEEVQSIAILCDNDQTILGYSIGVSVDSALLTIVSLTRIGTVSETADFFAVGEDADSGIAGMGVVFDTDGDFSSQKLDAGSAQLIGLLEVVAASEVDAETPVVFEPVEVHASRPPINNVMTNVDGFSIKAGETEPSRILTLENGTVTLATGAPVITSLDGNSGRPGDVFQVVGENFDEAGLTLTICGSEAQAVLREDGVTIDVTAPSCENLGWQSLLVETDRGSDSETNGFFYDDPPPNPLPVITSIDPQSAERGAQITINGENFDQAGFTLTICDTVPTHDAPAATSVVATVPDCDTSGTVTVEICNEFGCTTADFDVADPAGNVFIRGDADFSGGLDLTDGIRILNFLFLGGPAAPCLDAMDANDSGGIDLTDGIYVFNFLFLGGSQPPPPYPDCGSDPTEDGTSCEVGNTRC